MFPRFYVVLLIYIIISHRQPKKRDRDWRGVALTLGLRLWFDWFLGQFFSDLRKLVSATVTVPTEFGIFPVCVPLSAPRRPFAKWNWN